MYQRVDGAVLGQEHIRLLTLVDIFEPLSRDEIETIQWKHLNTSVAEGETFYTPMDLCETLFVLQRGKVRLHRAANSRSRSWEAARFSGRWPLRASASGTRTRRHSKNRRSPPCAVPTSSVLSWTGRGSGCNWYTY